MQKESIYYRMTNAEKEVATTLKEYGIQWSYEQTVFVGDENKRPRVWMPDFYLTPFGIYLKVCGSRDFNYDYRKQVFSKNGYCVIYLHVCKEVEKWNVHFIKFLHYFVKKRARAFSNIFSEAITL